MKLFPLISVALLFAASASAQPLLQPGKVGMPDSTGQTATSGPSSMAEGTIAGLDHSQRVPEPATFIMLLTGLSGIGALCLSGVLRDRSLAITGSLHKMKVRGQRSDF